MDKAAVHKLVRHIPRYDHEENTYSGLEEFAYLCNKIIFQDLKYILQGVEYLFQGLKHQMPGRGLKNSTKYKKIKITIMANQLAQFVSDPTSGIKAGSSGPEETCFLKLY